MRGKKKPNPQGESQKKRGPNPQGQKKKKKNKKKKVCEMERMELVN